MSIRRQAAFFVITLVALAGSRLIAQQRGAETKFTGISSSVTIPLDIDNNIIRMKVRVNGSRELTMIFDTGASMTSIDEQLVTELGLKVSGEKLNGKGTGGNFGGSYVKSAKLSVDGAEVSDQPLAAFKLNKPPGFDFDGIIGYDFINAFVVEINYEKKILTLRDPKSYVYRGNGEIIPLDLTGRKTPLITTTFKVNRHSSIAARLEVDSGFDGVFQLNSPVVKKRGLLKIFQNGKNAVSHGAGGDEQDVMVRVAHVRFGRIEITNPPVALSLDRVGAGAASDREGLVGGEVMRRFKVILDYSRRRMILERNKTFNDPYEDDTGDFLE